MTMSRLPHHLRARLLLIAIVAIAPAVITVGVSLTIGRTQSRERVIAEHLRLARVAANAEAGVIDGARRLLLTLAEFPMFASSDPAHCGEVLPNILRAHPTYFNINVVNPDGTLFCSATPIGLRARPSVSDQAWFRRLLATRSTALGDYQLSFATGKPAIVVAHPIVDGSGHLVRVVSVTLGLAGLEAVVATAEMPPGATITLFDRTRTVLVRIPNDGHWVGRQAPMAATLQRLLDGAASDVSDDVGIDGRRRVYVTLPVRGSIDTGLFLGMGVDTATVFAEANRTFRTMLWLLVVISIAAIGAGVIAGHMFVMKPMRALRAVTERLAAGDLNARAAIAAGIGGVGDLEEAVKLLATALDARERARDRAEQERRDSEERYRLLFARNPHPMWVYDAATLEFLEVNDAAIARYGYSRDEFRAMRITDIRPAEDLPRLQESLAASREAFDHSAGWRHTLKSGEVIDVDISSHNVTYGGRAAVLTSALDVTDRNRAQAALLERIATTALTADIGMSLNRTHDLQPCLKSCVESLIAHLDAAGACIWTVDESGLVLELQAAAGIAAARRDQFTRVLVGQGAIGRIARHQRAHSTTEAIGDVEVDDQEWIAAEQLRTFIGCPLVVESRVVGVVAVYGRTALSEVTMTAIASSAELIALGVARHRAESARRFLASIVANSDDAIIGATIDGTIVSWNAGAEKLFGYAADEVIGRSATLLRPDGSGAGDFGLQLNELRRGGHVIANDVLRRRRDGSLVPVSITLSPIVDGGGQVSGVSATMRDMTARQEAERTVRESEERFRLVAETVTQVFWIADVSGAIRYVSPAYERIWGRAVETLSGEPHGFYDAVHPEDRDAVLRTTALQQLGRPFEHEYRIVRPDGEVRWIRASGFPVMQADSTARQYVGVAEDVTARRSLEEQLRQSQKMEAIGQLAGGIAHDFNNLLTAILGFSSFVAESLPEDDRRRADVEEIRSAGERAAALTRQLLAFGRKQILEVRVLHVGDVVGELTPMLRRLIGESIDLTTSIDDHDLVKADPGQLQQVLVNLAVNAKDAMRDGGRLTIETADVMLDDAFVRTHPSASPGPHVTIKVSDTGHGIDADVQKRIFEPFFTTKPQGQGTGLGLATAYGIVSQSGGSIWVESEPDHGATFVVCLPTTEEAKPACVPAAKPRVQGGSETILLVEDEELVREWVYKVLSRRGYAVHAFGEPSRAISYAEEHRSRIDLVLSDVVLPDMCGKTMVAEVQARHPESRALFMSGYADHAIVQQGVLDPDTWFLQKPFTADLVAQKVREVIDAS
jgi:PAS domain S-box-containing protein